MKIKTQIKDASGILYQTEYDDIKKIHTTLDRNGNLTKDVSDDLCSPINEQIVVNGREYTVQTDHHTGRKLCAFTKDKPFDYREFSSNIDYEEFLNNK